MFFTKRRLWGFALSAAIVVLTPALGLCVEEDPYIYRILSASIYLEYENGTKEDNGISSEYTAFQQTYRMDTLGNILSRRLAIYDASVTYILDNFEQGNSSVDTSQTTYDLSTTILPKSSIPLKLYATRQHNKTKSTVENERTKTTYGLRWYAKFKALPETRLHIENQNNVNQNGGETSTTKYNLDLRKELGPTDNRFFYNLVTSTSNSASGTDSQSQAIGLTNVTFLSRATKMDMAFTHGDSTSEDPVAPEMNVDALSIGLQSRPSLEFNQTHRYTWYKTSNDGSDSVNGTYSGNMSYRFTDRLDSNLSLTAGEAKTDSVDKSETVTNLSTGFGLNYRLSNKLSLAETVSYTRMETTAETPTNPNKELFRVLSHINYADQLSWTYLTSSLRLGYNREKSTEEASGSGLETGLGVGLGNIDFNRYVSFSTSADWSKVYNLSGDIWSDSKSFNASAANKLWRRYAQVTARFSKSSQSSWQEATSSSSENWNFSASSNYFRNTHIEAVSDHTKTDNSITGDLVTNNDQLTVTHNRRLAGGSLDMSFIYSMLSSENVESSSSFSTASLYAKYEKQLPRNLRWVADANLSRGQGDEGNYRNMFSLTNNFVYPFRAWLLSAEHKYRHTEDQNRDIVENIYMLKAMRQFLWLL